MAADRIDEPTSDLKAELLARLRDVVPEAFADGELDLDRLAELAGEAVTSGPERDGLTWPGKREANRDAASSVAGDLGSRFGSYNPDWAIVMENPDDGGQALYLLRETKGTLDLSKLRPDEQRKIKCGRHHFAALGVNYAVVSAADQLPNGGV